MPQPTHNIDALVKSSGVPIKRIAAACDISEKTLSNWRNGVNAVPSDKLPILAGKLGVSIDELMAWDTQQSSKEAA